MQGDLCLLCYGLGCTDPWLPVEFKGLFTHIKNNPKYNMILQTSCVNRAVNAVLPGSIVNNTDQSIDSLLADDEGQEVEQREPVTQLQASNDGQVYEAGYATPPLTADILAASVDSIMVYDDMQEQRRNEPEPQVPINDVMEDLEHSIRT